MPPLNFILLVKFSSSQNFYPIFDYFTDVPVRTILEKCSCGISVKSYIVTLQTCGKKCIQIELVM